MAAKQLPPTDYLRQCFLYDPETGVLTWKPRPINHFGSERAWKHFNALFAGKQAGTIQTRSDGRSYVSTHLAGLKFPAHRVIWAIFHGADPGNLVVDHKDGCGINNRLDNLRAATLSQNSMNSRRVRQGLKGAHFYKRTGRWESSIKQHGRSIRLGYFDTQEEAHAAYCAKAAELFGEFARAA